MVNRPCLDCGKLTPRTRCPRCTSKHNRQRGSSTQRGYDSTFRALVAEAITDQPWCSDCGIGRADAKATNNPLTGDHLQWPALTVYDIDVCCRTCNSKRGPLRGGQGRGAPRRRK